MTADATATFPDEAFDDPQHSAWTVGSADPLPTWVTSFREHQVAAACDVVDRWARGETVVWLDAPTGAGKTLIAEMCRRMWGYVSGVGRLPCTYVASGLELQDQFARDFAYANVLKGKANYLPVRGPRYATCADCSGRACKWCVVEDADGEVGVACPYRQARGGALSGELCVTNTAYLLGEVRGVPNGLRARVKEGITIIDECDVLEQAMMGVVEWRASGDALQRMGVRPLKKGVHGKTVAAWLTDEWVPAAKARMEQLRPAMAREDLSARREATRLSRGIPRALEVAKGFGVNGEGEEGGDWIRDYDDHDERAVIFRPVEVGWAGGRLLWDHVDGEEGARVLCMSATILDARLEAGAVGVEREGGDGKRWGYIAMGSTYKAENRQVVVVPLVDMGYKAGQGDAGKVRDAKLVRGLEVILKRHPDANTVLHTVSYHLTRQVVAGVEGLVRDQGRMVWTYNNARERAEALEGFKQHGGVLVGPSVDRGVDLPGDLCRVQVVCKVPYLSLKDRQVAARLRGREDGQRWYEVAALRTLIQMSGRGVRSEEDWAVCYVLDRNAMRMVQSGVVPAWWKEGVVFGRVHEYGGRGTR